MTFFRGVAILLLTLLLFAQSGGAQAQAGPLSQAELSQAQFLPYAPPSFRGRCPRLCVEWFDGCNMCTCGKGALDVCTQMLCRTRRRARCMRWGF